MKLPEYVSESVKRLNPELFNPSRLENSKRKRDEWRQGEDPKLGRGAPSMVWRVTIISMRRRLVDAHDNLRTGAKPLVDAITASLGFANDSDDRLQWEYQQIKTRGAEATIVKLDRIESETTNVPECV